MLSFLPKSPNDIMEDLRDRFKTYRKSLNISQQELSLSSDVSLGSLKRFEQSGKISIQSLLKLAFVLGCLDDFEKICVQNKHKFKTIEDVINDN